MTELYKKHRPKKFEEMVGNTSTIKSLQNMIKRKTVPHTILFHGPSGCGKTTLARILKDELRCGQLDFRELNCSDFRGIDTVREIREYMSLAPSGGNCRIWLLDEIHQMSSAGMNATLKIFEDTPKHVYFFLCTTDPQKLIKTIRTRCCEMPVELLSEKDIKKLLLRVSKREKIKIKQQTAEEIYDVCEGSARKSLVILDKLKNIPQNEWSGAIREEDSNIEGIELCRALINKKGWVAIKKILSNLKGEPESIRWAVMGYCSSILLKKEHDQAFHILTCFEDNFYDSKRNGLIRACYESIH